MKVHHSVDWQGLSFVGKALLALMVVSGGIYFSQLYASSSRASGEPNMVLIQQQASIARGGSTLALSTTTSKHIINTLTIADAVPASGKFITADLVNNVLTLYEDGSATAKYPILAAGAPSSPYAAPEGVYAIQSKNPDRFFSAGLVHQKWSVQFAGNYSIHGTPYREDGAAVDADYKNDSIEVSTSDAERVFDFADKGTSVFVYDPIGHGASSLVLDTVPQPSVTAASYLVADVDTGDVFAERAAQSVQPIGSTATLLTALAADETVPFDTNLSVLKSDLSPTVRTKTRERLTAGQLIYPLLMNGSAAAATSLAEASQSDLISWINALAGSLDMPKTRISDLIGTSTASVTTADDLFHLAAYLAANKTFILSIAKAPQASVLADSGTTYRFTNTVATGSSLVSLVSVPLNGTLRRAAVIVLGSDNAAIDANALGNWYAQSTRQGAEMAATACVTCTPAPAYRKIQL